MKGSKIRKWCWLIVLLTLCLLCTGCQEGNNADQEQVYVFYESNVTHGDWRNHYGAIGRDGTLVLSLDARVIEILCDQTNGQQLWLQTRERYVDDPTLTVEELYQDDNWVHIRDHYRLYDLQGNLLEDTGERAIYKIYGDLVFYNDGKVTDRRTGQTVFEEVGTFTQVEQYYVMDSADYETVTVADANLQVVQQYPGYVRIAGNRLIVKQDKKLGIRSLDGTEITPCQYDSILYTTNDKVRIAKQNDQYYVVSLENGEVLFTAPDSSQIPVPDHDAVDQVAIGYADEERAVLEYICNQDNGGRASWYQMYNYDGQAISDRYAFIFGREDEMLQAEKSDGLFWAEQTDGSQVLLNGDGDPVYVSQRGNWSNQNVTQVTPERLVINCYNNGNDQEGQLQDLAGNQINTKKYEFVYPQYMFFGIDYLKVPLVIGSYNFGNTTLNDLLDMEGNVLIERAKRIQVLDADRFWVEKGFEQGLMDAKGNWLYRQSVFDSSADE